MRVTTENTKKTAETETKNASVKKEDEQSTESARKKAEKPSGNAAARNYTYILKCGDGSLYTGWTNDIAARLEQHRSGKGAKYTRGRGPLELVYEKNDILYGRLRPYLNKVLLAEKEGICSTEFHVMRVIDTETVLPEYVAAILRSDLILSQTKHMMTGNTHPRISNDDVKNLYIPVPDIGVQAEIVKELGKRRIEARMLALALS